MNNQVAKQQQLALSDNPALEQDWLVMKQLEDIKDQTAYMKEFRTSLGSALDEIKVLRCKLAQEKSKSLEILQEKHKPKFPAQPSSKEEMHALQSSFLSLDTNGESNTDSQKVSLVGTDVTRIIAESDERLDRITDIVGQRTKLIRDLKKNMQQSSIVLQRRERKLEEKIHQGKDLKSELQKVVTERDTLKVALEQKSENLAKEQTLVHEKDKEIKDLLNKMSNLEKNLNSMYHHMSDRDKQLNDARNQLLSFSPCSECAWMQDYIHRLEYQLQHYRYAEATATPYRNSNDTLNSSSHYNHHSNGWSDSRHQHRTNNPTQRTPDSQQRSSYQRTKRSDAYWRQQAASRQRIQEFRNASLALSPIKEDSEEPITSTGSNSSTKADRGSANKLMSVMIEEPSSQTTENKYNNVTSNQETNSNHVPATNITPTTQSESYHYFTVRTKQNAVQPANKEGNSMAYFHIASGENDSQTAGATRHISSTLSTLHTEKNSSRSPLKEQFDSNCAREDARYGKHLSSTPMRPSETPLLHRVALTNARSSPDLSSQKKGFTPVRSFPFLSGSVTSSGSVASTESAASDTTGCSSDSGLAHQNESTKRVKARRTKRNRQNSKYIMFRDHKIDVTRFSTSDFRQIMWSLCGDSNAADEFLNFLSSHAKRLQNDPQWSEKHSLGSPEEWLALKGSY